MAEARLPLEGPACVSFSLPEGWIALELELGGDRIDPMKQLGAQFGEIVQDVTEAAERGPEAMGEAMGKLMTSLNRGPRANKADFEFCPECVRELVVTMKG